MKQSFILHKDSLCILDKLTDEQAGKLFKAIYLWQQTKELPELDVLLDMAITPFINQFMRDDILYEKTSEDRKIAGSLGGKKRIENLSKKKKTNKLEANQASASNFKQIKQDQANQANQADSDSDNDSDNVSDSKKVKYRNNISLTKTENDRLVSELGQQFVDACYDYLRDYKIEKAYTSKNDNLTIRRWVIDAVRKKPTIVSMPARKAYDPYDKNNYWNETQWEEAVAKLKANAK